MAGSGVDWTTAASADRRERVETDHVICATGYRADVGRLPFLAPDRRTDVRTVARAPALSTGFESSVPGLYFAGITAAVSFGPLMRFMYGDAFAAQRISSQLARGGM